MPRPSLARFRPVIDPGIGARFAAALLLVVLTALVPPAALGQEATPVIPNTAESPLVAATGWLLALQDDSGAFPGFSGEPDPGATTDAVIALYAARESDPQAGAAVERAMSYLAGEAEGYARIGAGQAAKLAMAAVAGGHDPRAFGGVDLLAAMQAPPTQTIEHPIAGIFGADLYSHALVLLAFVAVGEPVDDAAITPFRATQNAAGGWAFDGSTDAGAADSNTTALILQALAASGHGDDPMIGRGLAFLKALLAPDGGFASGPTEPLVADANSTALVIQALIATGQNPAAPEWGDAPGALARFQTPSGGLRYLADDEAPNLLATLQAIPALAGAPLPVATGCAEGESPGTGGCLPLAA
jgi:hypothetical protein